MTNHKTKGNRFTASCTESINEAASGIFPDSAQMVVEGVKYIDPQIGTGRPKTALELPEKHSYFPFSVPLINAATSAWNCFSTSSFT